ncbi:hypothetical protein Tco_0584009 [Tanacetum coccineum]
MVRLFPRTTKGFIWGEVVAESAEMVRPSQGDKGYVRPAWSEMSKKARNRGGPREARRNMGVYAPYPQKDTLTPLIKTPKEILAMESHNTNDCYQLKKQIEEAMASGKLAHLVDIRRNNQQNGNQGRNGVKIINMIREEGNHKRPFEEGRSEIMNELTFLAIPQSQLTDKPIILEGIVEGNRVRRILVDGGSSSEIMYEHCFRNLDINVRSRLKRVQGSWKEVQWHQREEKMSRIREQAILRGRSNFERRPGLGPVSLEKTRSKEDIEEVFTISHERPNQYVTMGATLTTNCK